MQTETLFNTYSRDYYTEVAARLHEKGWDMSYWDSYYRHGRIPWDPGPYDRHLPRILQELSIGPCPVVDIGCGTGKSLIWLAQRGFPGTGIDISPEALRRAEELAGRTKVVCKWLCGSFPEDFPPNVLPDESFDLAIDRGCLQHVYSHRLRMRFARGVARLLHVGGYWYSLTACRDGVSRFDGVPRWSRREIVDLVQPFFEITLLRESVFTLGEPGSMSAWLCVVRKKEELRSGS